MKFTIPDFSLVLLIGPTGAGKSTLARRHFLDTEIVSSDYCRAFVCDDESDQGATKDAFELLNYMVGMRLKRRRLTVVDATSVRREDRAELVRMARRYHALPVALVLDLDPKICHERNAGRPKRDFGAHVPRNHSRNLRRGLRGLGKEGFRHIHIMKTPEEVASLEIERQPLWTDLRELTGPFDIIGDVHGCFDELTTLLADLGYQISPFDQESEDLIQAHHPQGRIAFFVGDLTDRGPRNKDALRLAMGMVRAGSARWVLGNHDFKLLRWLNGRKVKAAHGLDRTVAELEACSDGFRSTVRDFLQGLLSHAWLDGGQLVVAHAGLKEEMHGRGSGAVRNFCMFGETTGEIDSFGLPVRIDWARDYRGEAAVVYGHTPMPEAEWLNNTICIDTGCVFGGKLSALRWPERELVSVPAAQVYCAPTKPLGLKSELSAQQDHDRLLFFDDYLGKRRIETRFNKGIAIAEENTLAALETVSRFAVDPRWLIYLPPTMSPCATASEGDFLEHPDQALDYFTAHGVEEVVAEEKHMGSRALLIICRDEETARCRFGVEDGKAGVIYSRTGRPFFRDEAVEAQIVKRLGAAVAQAGLWSELDTDWLLLDGEVMPWSAKAQDLLIKQYGPTVQAAKTSASALAEVVGGMASLPEGLPALLAEAQQAHVNALAMERTIAGYCWQAETLDDFRIAPFHLLAAEGQGFSNRPHAWHMKTLQRLCDADPILQATTWHQLDPRDGDDRKRLTDWWLDHTSRGGEGMVVKPAAFVAGGSKGLIQPAIKVRGRDYLRIIYGPDYDRPENLSRLRQRGLNRKQSLALREFALGLEGLHRFVERQPLSKVHECILGVLALESQPVDPRL